MIEDLGLLPPEEEQAYRFLVKLSAARSADLARVAEVSQHEAARLLKILQAKGLVMVQAGDDPVFRPLSPEVALGSGLLRRQESLEKARRAVDALTEEYRASARQHEAHHLVEVIVGAVALRDRLAHLQSAAREEVLWFCRANPVALHSGENTAEFDALARGVRYRVIYDREFLEAPGTLDNAIEGMRWGQEARALSALPVRLAIVDRSVAVCPLVRNSDSAGGEPTAALIGRSELLNALLALFETHWDLATPIRMPDGAAPAVLTGDGPEGPDDSERFLMSLMVAGVPDKAIASQLGVSRRTVQRRLDRLMALAGVDTRVGLAFQAARHNWI